VDSRIIQNVIINGIDKNGNPYLPNTPLSVTDSTKVNKAASINRKKNTEELSKKEPKPKENFFSRYFIFHLSVRGS
jgi:hypothetical protein